DPERLAVAAKDFPGIETYRTVEEMLRKSSVNLVTLITPHNTHAPLAMKCLKAGRHVVAEKPMAVTTAECDAMIAAAKRAKVVLSTYHNRHWDGIILGAMEQIRAGAIGDVVRIEMEMGRLAKPRDWWRSSKSISGGILYDWGVHLCEYILQMVDSDIAEVSGFTWSGVWASQTRWKKDTIEDDGQIVIRFTSGAWATIQITSLDARPHEPWFKVVGTQGTLAPNWQTSEITTLDGDKRITTQFPSPPSQGYQFYQNIADHLVKGSKLVITPEWSRRPIHIIDLACRSAKAGKAMKPKYR
ncbi:MAG: Gfo/Idh/MocA family oxidoreductase, partial [Lentisphaerae bacterium]|nr:Gfo/Idh/MocA family oxidoreductase [Lentisphaerota bacterium]